MKKLVYLSLLLCFIAHGQDSVFDQYTWEKKPKFRTKDLDQSEALVSLKTHTVKEFLYEEDNGLVEYNIEHHATWLNSDARIEEYNKVYIPYNSNSLLIASKARVIQANGKIVELDESKILTAKDEENGRTYKYFAFEGIEKGSVVEYYYILKKNPSYQGTRVVLQSDYLQNNVSFELFAPKNLIFDFKSYHGIPEVKQDTLDEERNHYIVCLIWIGG